MKIIKITFFVVICVISINCNPTKYKNNMCECNIKISNFLYPNYLNTDTLKLYNLSYICKETFAHYSSKNNSLFDRMDIIFSDRYYTIFKFDEKTELLNDRKLNQWFAFKVFEPFYFTRDKDNGGVCHIYILDDDLQPLFSFDNSSIYKYKTVRENGFLTYSFSKIKLSNNQKIKIEELSYEIIVEISKQLKENHYTLTTDYEELLFHDELLPLWTDL